MPLLRWIPVAWQPLSMFLLHVGVLSVFYTWILLTVIGGLGMVWSALKIPGDLSTILRATIGHYVLTAMTVTLTLTSFPPLGRFSTYASIAGAFLWLTMAPELYEEYGSSPTKTQTSSRLLFVLRFLLLLVWMVLFVVALQDVVTIPLGRGAFLNEALASMLSLPYSLGVIIGLAGLYALFRTIFKGVFATIGLLQELPAVIIPAHDL